MGAGFDLCGLSKGQRPICSFSAPPSLQMALLIYYEAKGQKQENKGMGLTVINVSICFRMYYTFAKDTFIALWNNAIVLSAQNFNLISQDEYTNLSVFDNRLTKN